jgi:hypothetical protein
MSKKRFEVVEELDPASITSVPDVHKKHYKELGYKPYRMGDGRIKWLTESEKAYNRSRSVANRLSLKKKTHVKHTGQIRKKRHRNTLVGFLANNWAFLLIAAIVLAIVIVYLR